MFPALRISRFRAVFLAPAFALIAALALSSVAAAAPRSIAQIEAESKAAASRLDLQQDLPDRVSRQLDLQSELPKDDPPPKWNLRFPRELLWALFGVGLILLLYALKDVIPAFGTGEGRWSEEPTPDAASATNGAAAAAAVAADELASQGRYAEAMHVLLLQSLGDIRRRLDARFADSLTSREILQAIPLSDAGRASLHDIIARVERTYFGQYPAGAEDYQACRASFTDLTQAMGGPAIA
jgi:hypothetical protein